MSFDTIVKDTVFGDQGYLAHAADIYQFPIFELGIEYNLVGSMIRNKGLTQNTMNHNYVFHLTSSLNGRERYDYAKRLDDYFSELEEYTN